MNEMTPQEIAESLEYQATHIISMPDKDRAALEQGATYMRKIANGELRPIVKCGECKLHESCTFEETFITAGIAESHRYCGAGERKDGKK